jgi:hypothetical protein
MELLLEVLVLQMQQLAHGRAIQVCSPQVKRVLLRRQQQY